MSSLSFTKLFSSITDSSIWQEPAEVRVVWVTLLAMADQLGRVFASNSGLARRANVSRESTELALAVFLAPDSDSRTADHEGRRIEPIAGGWQLLNYKMYREMKDEEARKEKNRIYQERHRSKSDKPDSKEMSDKNLTVRNSKEMSAQEEAEEEAEVESTNTSTLASSSTELPAARGKLVCTLPLNQGDHNVFEADVRQWQALYPAVDIRQELRNAKGWLLGSPQRRKTKNGIGKFVNAWLSRAQNNAKPTGGGNDRHGKTGGNLKALEQALAFAGNYEAADDVGREASGTSEPFDAGDLRPRSSDLLPA